MNLKQTPYERGYRDAISEQPFEPPISRESNDYFQYERGYAHGYAENMRAHYMNVFQKAH